MTTIKKTGGLLVCILIFFSINMLSAAPIQKTGVAETEKTAPQKVKKRSVLSWVLNKKIKKAIKKYQNSNRVAMAKTEPLAIVSPILGVLGIIGWIASVAASFALSKPGVAVAITLGVLATIGAIITGILGLKRINNDSANLKGKGLAIAGLVLGGLAAVLFLINTIGALFF